MDVIVMMNEWTITKSLNIPGDFNWLLAGCMVLECCSRRDTAKALYALAVRTCWSACPLSWLACSTLFVQDGETRHITQYHYTTWPDHGIPTATALVDFWRTVRTSHRNLKSPSPLLVHCRSVLVEFSSALWGFPFQNVMLIIATK